MEEKYIGKEQREKKKRDIGNYQELLTCSDKFMRTTLCPENFPKATIKLVFPTPGLPSNKTGQKKKVN